MNNSELHVHHGIMLMPTRQDSQGISTCEGMSSGLVPVTTKNTAIPEYIYTDCGSLADNAAGLAQAIDDLYNNPKRFIELSPTSAEFVRKKCGIKIVIEQELKLLKG